MVVAATLHEGDERWGDDFDGFAHYWHDEAQRVGFDVMINRRHIGYGNTPWLDWYVEEAKPRPLLPPWRC